MIKQDNRQRSSSVSSAGGNANRVTEDKVHHLPISDFISILVHLFLAIEFVSAIRYFSIFSHSS